MSCLFGHLPARKRGPAGEPADPRSCSIGCACGRPYFFLPALPVAPEWPDLHFVAQKKLVPLTPPLAPLPGVPPPTVSPPLPPLPPLPAVHLLTQSVLDPPLPPRPPLPPLAPFLPR